MSFDERFNGNPSILDFLAARMPLMAQPPQPSVDPMATGAIPVPPVPPQQGGMMPAPNSQPHNMNAPIQVPLNDPSYFPPAPSADRGPITQQHYQASLNQLQPQQMAQQTSSQPAQSPSGNGVEKIAAFLQGLGSGNGVLSAIGGGIGAVNNLGKENKTISYLTSRGIPQGEAELLAQHPQSVFQVLQNMRKGEDPKARLELQKLGYEVDAARLKAQGGGEGATEYGLNPIWGQDEQGNAVLGVLGKDGSFKKVDTGQFDISSGTEQIDLGDSFAIKDKRSGQIIGSVPKNLANAERDKKIGAAQGEAAASLPTDLATADRALTELDALIKHPGISSIAGSMDQFRPSWSMGAEGKDALSRFNQAKGRAFLQAFGMLKGGGAITEIEGLKAEQAMARMDRALDEAEFIQALQDFRDAVSDGRDKLIQRAGGPAKSGGVTTPASTGSVDYSDYFKQ